jgi:hypothetical protein
MAEWVRQGRIDRETVLHCHETNQRVAAWTVPALQPVLGLSPQQVAHFLQPPPPFAPTGPGYAQPQSAYPQAAPIGYASPYGGSASPAEHNLTTFSTTGAVLLSIFVPFFSLIFYGLVHGNLPKRRADDPGAGKAIGFMFIPFFNIYWICFFWLRLCTRIDDERARAGLPPAAPRGLMVAILCCYLGLLIPIVNLFVALAIFVMMIVFLANLQASINGLVQATRSWR